MVVILISVETSGVVAVIRRQCLNTDENHSHVPSSQH